MTPDPFLRIPPFPAHRAGPLARERGDGAAIGPVIAVPSSGDIIAALRKFRVGGTFWGPLAELPPGRGIVLSASSAESARRLLDHARETGLIERAVLVGQASPDPRVPSLLAADPWALCDGAGQVIASAEDDLVRVAAVLGLPASVLGEGGLAVPADPNTIAAGLHKRWCYRDPFHSREIGVLDAIAMLGRWRALIDANRSVASVYGIARWKRITADTLLWDGSGPVRHDRSPPAGGQVLSWIARSDAGTLSMLRENGTGIGEIEDGMIRSTGLGANCVPPLSIVVDSRGPHFDPAQASELELILETAEIDAPVLARAAQLREHLVRAGISKYGQDRAHAPVPPAVAGRRRVLVTGQVEDDRSVLCGGGGLDNLELLRRARMQEPDAHIVFKPHPDVEAGHRKGHIPDALALELADEIDRTSSIAALLDQVDAVHVLTSLAGFEALMRGREVVTHGVPFYAGWGLTRDLGQVPARRSRRRTLDELVAATLILYPRYVDPITRLPCEVEVLVERIDAGQAQVRSPLIRLREWQGRLNRVLGWRDRR